MADPYQDLTVYLAQIVNETLDESAVIQRTGKTLACRVEEDTQRVRLPHLPRPIELVRWTLTFANSQDVQVGDVATVTGIDHDPLSKTFGQKFAMGTYCTLDRKNPATYSVATELASVRQRKGDNTLDLLTNQTVTFIRKTSPAATATTLPNKPVLIWAASPMERTEALGVGLDFDWSIAFDPQYSFGGNSIRDGDQIRWNGPRATPAEATAGGKLYTLKEVDVHFNPFPLVTAVFSETR